MQTRLAINAYAKINLGLDVLRRREDGYHDVRMIMQSVDLHDVITLEKITGGIEIISDNPDVPDDEHNLAYKAAKLIFDEYGISEGVRISIYKNIPVAAGLAGGSTDAAAVLKGINRLFSLSKSDEELMQLGVKIGADVPYCIMGGTAVSEGIGEVLTKLDGMPECKILIAKPPINVSTKYVYENLHVDKITRHPDIDSLINAVREGSINKIASGMENILENVTAVKYPVIDELKQLMLKNGALNSIMSGSGPTVFGIFDDEDKADAAFSAVGKTNITKEIYLSNIQGMSEGYTQ